MLTTQLVRLHLQYVFAYRAHFLFSLLTGPLYFLTQYFVWSALLAGGAVAGYELESIVTYFVIVMLLQYAQYDRADERIERHVREGTLSQILLRPLTLHRWLFTEKIAFRTLAIVLEIVPLALLALIVFGPGVLTPRGNMAFFALAVAVCFVMRYLINTLIGLLAFWMTRIHGIKMLFWPAFLFLTGALFPLDILPMWAQHIVFWLPAQHLLFAPTQLFMGSYSLAGYTDPVFVLGIGIAWVVGLWLLVLTVQRQAYNTYQGVGQ